MRKGSKMAILEDLQDAKARPQEEVKDTFGKWPCFTTALAAMLEDAKEVNNANEHLRHARWGTGERRPPGLLNNVIAIMRAFGRPCTRLELDGVLGVDQSTTRRYLAELIHSDEVTTDRNDERKIIYVLVAGYEQGELEL